MTSTQCGAEENWPLLSRKGEIPKTLDLLLCLKLTLFLRQLHVSGHLSKEDGRDVVSARNVPLVATQ